MQELKAVVEKIFSGEIIKTVISKPHSKSETIIKIVAEKKENYFQLSSFTEKQVFHRNIEESELLSVCYELMISKYTRLNAWTKSEHHSLMISKKGKVFHSAEKCETKAPMLSHNREKQYILSEGTIIPPLIDMGIFTYDGHVIKSMYDKFKQINRYIEVIDDVLKKKSIRHLNIIDFGCGKSYLTFVVYYYLTEIKKISVDMIGLDLKADVISHCNEIAKKYNYSNLKFELGDINGYKSPFKVDMVITLHACDTATDYALFNAIQWDASMIFSVPCCQHEINKQIKTDNFSILTKYGIISERFSALLTDAIRGNLLEYMGYNTQLLEFIDFSHTPKNILIRATKKRNSTNESRLKALKEVDNVIDEYNLQPTLYKLLEGVDAIRR